MIVFFCTRRNRMPIDRYLAAEIGSSVYRRILPVEYEEAFAIRNFPQATYIFSDVDLLTGPDKRRATEIHEHLVAKGIASRILNHPERSMARIDLLGHLRRKSGANAFSAHPIDALSKELRFPVFVRSSMDHMGSRTDLINDQLTLDRTIHQLKEDGHDLSHWIVTEFEDSSGEDGIYRKYSAFHVNGEIIPRHVLFSRHWMQKNPDLDDARFLSEEWDYILKNPHQEKLLEIFREASIDFGRIDYGLKRDGRIQVWEINTNPSILRIGYARSGSRSEIHNTFAASLRASFERLDNETAAPPEYLWKKQLDLRHQARRYYKDILWPQVRKPLRLASRIKRKLLSKPAQENAAVSVAEN